MVVSGDAVLVPLTPAVQLYVVAPFGIRVAVWPSQMVGELTVTTGNGFTVTVATAVDVQPSVVPVTVYDVVVSGDAVFVPLTPAVQLYVVAPFGIKVAVCPSQMVGEFTVTTGNGLTVTVAIAVAVQPNVVPVTV